MQLLRRAIWLFFSGFLVAAGVSSALSLAALGVRAYVKSLPESYKPPDPKDYQPPKSGEVEFSDLSFLEVTKSAGIRGNVTNKSAKPIQSFRVDVDLKRKGELLYTCSETVSIKVAPSTTTRFDLLCKDVDRMAITPDISPVLRVIWVYRGSEE